MKLHLLWHIVICAVSASTKNETLTLIKEKYIPAIQTLEKQVTDVIYSAGNITQWMRSLDFDVTDDDDAKRFTQVFTAAIQHDIYALSNLTKESRTFLSTLHRHSPTTATTQAPRTVPPAHVVTFDVPADAGDLTRPFDSVASLEAAPRVQAQKANKANSFESWLDSLQEQASHIDDIFWQPNRSK